MADSGFPLPTSSYKELVKIIQGYGKVGADASLADVAHVTAMHETIISANNKFLLAVGIIQGGKRKTITPIGAELANAVEHDLTDEIAAKWRAVVNGNDFLQKVVSAVRIRKGMDESSLETHVAYSAGQPKTPAVATGASTVVQMLKNSGLLKEEGGNLVAAAPEPPPIDESLQKESSIFDVKSSNRGEVSRPPLLTSTTLGTTNLGSVQLRIDVTVQCTPKDLDDLGQKLRKVIQDFNQQQNTSETKNADPTAPNDSPDDTER